MMVVLSAKVQKCFRELQPSDGFVQVVLISNADIWRFEEMSETENGQNEQPK